jgi:hypothetical protein
VAWLSRKTGKTYRRYDHAILVGDFDLIAAGELQGGPPTLGLA